MFQEDIFSHLPHAETTDSTSKPFGFSEIHLFCGSCGHEIRLDCLISGTADQAWPYVEADHFANAVSRKRNKKDREEGEADADL